MKAGEKSSVISFPKGDGVMREKRVERSLQFLLDTMNELQEIERITGRTGLSDRVCLSAGGILMDVMRYARACHE